MRYNKIRQCDIANGPGIRTSLFVQGCNRRCKGCFNPETHDFNGGRDFSEKVKKQFISLGLISSIVGYSILGGEPMVQGEDMLSLLKDIRAIAHYKSVWVWTGFTYQELIENKIQRKMLQYIDVLVDGAYDEKLKTPNLQFRGSYNQRIIDVNASLKANDIVLSSLFN